MSTGFRQLGYTSWQSGDHDDDNLYLFVWDLGMFARWAKGGSFAQAAADLLHTGEPQIVTPWIIILSKEVL